MRVFISSVTRVNLWVVYTDTCLEVTRGRRALSPEGDKQGEIFFHIYWI